MSVLPPWPPKTQLDVSFYALLVTAASLIVNAVTLLLAEMRRQERISIWTNFNHKANREQLSLLDVQNILGNYPNIATGDRCLRITVGYSGPHSMEIFRVLCVRAFLPPFPVKGQVVAVLRNSQKISYLVPPIEVVLGEVVGIVVELQGGGKKMKNVQWRTRLGRWWFYKKQSRKKK